MRGRRALDNNIDAQKTRERILQAARHVFAKHPFKSATTRMIANEAGVEHPLIHYYFGSKEKLFEEVTAELYEEFGKGHSAWLDDLPKQGPEKGLSLYLDRLLEYHREHPQAMQIILLNMAQIGSPADLPGYRYITLHMDRMRSSLAEKIPLQGSLSDIEMFIHCFHQLIIALLGAKTCQAIALNMDPDGQEFYLWVKQAAMRLFLPWLERLIRKPGR